MTRSSFSPYFFGYYILWWRILHASFLFFLHLLRCSLHALAGASYMVDLSIQKHVVNWMVNEWNEKEHWIGEDRRFWSWNENWFVIRIFVCLMVLNGKISPSLAVGNVSMFIICYFACVSPIIYADLIIFLKIWPTLFLWVYDSLLPVLC